MVVGQGNYTGCSIKTRTTLVINIFGTTNDTMMAFGLYDVETHGVLCTPFNTPHCELVCCAQDIKVVHKYLPRSAQHVFLSTNAHIAVIRERRSCRFATLVLLTTSLTNPYRKKNQGGYVWRSWGQAVGPSRPIQRPEIFHSGRLEQLRPNEGSSILLKIDINQVLNLWESKSFQHVHVNC